MSAEPSVATPSSDTIVHSATSPKRPSKSSKRTREDDASDSEEDLEGFIVKDSLYKKLTRKKSKAADENDGGHDSSSEDEEDEIEEDSQAIPDEDGVELTKVLQEEAAKLTQNLASTQVNGRTLRDRSKIEAPKDTYWETYGKKDYQKLMVKDEKKDYIDDLRSLKKDYDRNPDQFEEVPEDFRWPSVTMRDSLEAIKAAHEYVSDALGIVYTEDEEEEEEDDEAQDDSDEDSEVEEDSEDSDDDETTEDSEDSDDDDA